MFEIVVGDYGISYKIIMEGADLEDCTASIIVWREPEALSSLTENASSSQKDVVVADVSGFEVGEPVRIEDDTPQYEHNEIAEIDEDTKTLTMVNDLAYTYSTGNNAIVLMRILLYNKACGSITYDAAEDESYCYYDVVEDDFPLTAAVDERKTIYKAMVAFARIGDNYKEHDLGFNWVVHPAPPSEAS